MCATKVSHIIVHKKTRVIIVIVHHYHHPSLLQPSWSSWLYWYLFFFTMFCCFCTHSVQFVGCCVCVCVCGQGAMTFCTDCIQQVLCANQLGVLLDEPTNQPLVGTKQPANQPTNITFRIPSFLSTTFRSPFANHLLNICQLLANR